MPSLFRKARVTVTPRSFGVRLLQLAMVSIAALSMSMRMVRRNGGALLLPVSLAWLPTRQRHFSYSLCRHRFHRTQNPVAPITILPRTAAPGTGNPLALHVRFASSAKDAAATTEEPLPPNPLQESPPNERAELLNRCLDAILTATSSKSTNTTTLNGETETDPRRPPSQDLMEAALASLRDPSKGYDPNYGRPALRAYRSFVYPKKLEPEKDDAVQLEAAAKRTANQIDFLVKRQTSRITQAVRNHDDPQATADSTTTQQKFPITLVLDNLRGSFNVGSIFRTAEACGVSQILTCGITPHPFGSGAEKVAKSALGADLLVPTAHFDTTRQALLSLREQETAALPPYVVALETTAASELYTRVDYRPYYNGNHQNNDTANDIGNGRGIALILGNEVTGVDVELLAPVLQDEKSSSNTEDQALVDAIVELPTHGQKNSLNVAAVAPVILYEILRQWDDDDE